MKRGRPRLRLTVKVIQVKLRLYEGSDDDLIAFFARIPTRLRAPMVKRALRFGKCTSIDMANNSDETLDMLDSLVS